MSTDRCDCAIGMNYTMMKKCKSDKHICVCVSGDDEGDGDSNIFCQADKHVCVCDIYYYISNNIELTVDIHMKLLNKRCMCDHW